MSIEINGDWISQVSFKLPDGTLINLRGKDHVELRLAKDAVNVVFPGLIGGNYGGEAPQGPKVFVAPTTEVVQAPFPVRVGDVVLPPAPLYGSKPVSLVTAPAGDPALVVTVDRVYSDPGEKNGRHFVKGGLVTTDGRRFNTFDGTLKTPWHDFVGLKGQTVRLVLGGGKDKDLITRIEADNGGLV